MRRLPSVTPHRAAGLFGAAFGCLFLLLNDPDAMSPVALNASKWLLLMPAAIVFATRPSANGWTSALCLAGGVFAGACLAALLHASNIWPIAGVYWTFVFALPIALGSAAGALIHRFVLQPNAQ